LASSSKTYDFNESHADFLPVATWFQESQEGLILFIVFYSQACRWSKCLGCNLPSQGSKMHVSYKSLMAQVDYIFSDPKVVERFKDIKKVIVSNNGSILDQVTFSSTALMYFLARLNQHLPGVETLTIETRPEHVEFAELEFIARALSESQPPATLEIAVGFEAMDDNIRNNVFKKGLKLDVFENFIKQVVPYKYRIKCYFMLKPVPQMTDQQAIEDIQKAIDYLGSMVLKYGVPINMHLNPTYVAKGTPLAESFEKGEYSPPRLGDVARALQHARGKNLSVFIGLSDEGLAVEGGSFLRPGDEGLVEKLEEFNRTQDYDILETLAR
jgi:radical SAM enzyme (TIGR01210 family)